MSFIVSFSLLWLLQVSSPDYRVVYLQIHEFICNTARCCFYHHYLYTAHTYTQRIQRYIALNFFPSLCRSDNNIHCITYFSVFFFSCICYWHCVFVCSFHSIQFFVIIFFSFVICIMCKIKTYLFISTFFCFFQLYFSFQFSLENIPFIYTNHSIVVFLYTAYKYIFICPFFNN